MADEHTKFLLSEDQIPTHWVNLVACVYLLWSGVHILLDFPELYWGHTGYRG